MISASSISIDFSKLICLLMQSGSLQWNKPSVYNMKIVWSKSNELSACVCVCVCVYVFVGIIDSRYKS